MALRTAFTEAFSIPHPIALAPMGGVAGGALAAAVSDGGGLGLVGGGRARTDWLERELGIVARSTTRPWGVGFQSWGTDRATIEAALAFGPHAVMLAFGDPAPLAPQVRAAGLPLIVQVTDLEEARRAIDVGADVLVAQGAEAGGHGRSRATLPFVPAVVDRAGPIPVLAAGGIADGRGVAAALALGAAGALIGTRFEATVEAVLDPGDAKAILEGGAEDTARSRLSDVARRSPWPARYSARTVCEPALEPWLGREDELAADEAALEQLGAEVSRAPVWAGEGLDLINDLVPAAELVDRLAREAEAALTAAARAVYR